MRRLARIELDEDEKPKIDAEVEALAEDDPEVDQDRLKKKWSTVEHFEARTAALSGRAMVVCMSRRICVQLYDAITALRPHWHSDDDAAGAIKSVMTGAASDPLAWQPHIGNKARRDLLARRARDADDPLRLVIVRDMWLTGFDAPCLHTMYVDKPMRGHGLMQAIARVNRVFRDKPAGLIVDYIGIAQNLKSALQQYSRSDQDNTGVDAAQAAAVLCEKVEVVRAMYHGFDYRTALNGTVQERLRLIAHELLTSLRENVTVDWAHRESARARLRVLVKRILRKYGYPPDLQDAAVQTVLQQAEALSAAWVC